MIRNHSRVAAAVSAGLMVLAGAGLMARRTVDR